MPKISQAQIQAQNFVKKLQSRIARRSNYIRHNDQWRQAYKLMLKTRKQSQSVFGGIPGHLERIVSDYKEIKELLKSLHQEQKLDKDLLEVHIDIFAQLKKEDEHYFAENK